MAIIGERMSAHAPVRLSEVAEVLDQSAGLDAFTGNDVASDLRAVFERSYRRLGPEAAQLFRQLGDVDASVDPAAAADLTGVTRAEATSMLSELAGAGLVTRGSFHRYTVHDLVRTYARELDEQTPTRPRSRLVSAAGNMDREPRDAGVDPL
jgi:hypothetical protein